MSTIICKCSLPDELIKINLNRLVDLILNNEKWINPFKYDIFVLNYHDYCLTIKQPNRLEKELNSGQYEIIKCTKWDDDVRLKKELGV